MPAPQSLHSDYSSILCFRSSSVVSASVSRYMSLSVMWIRSSFVCDHVEEETSMVTNFMHVSTVLYNFLNILLFRSLQICQQIAMITVLVNVTESPKFSLPHTLPGVPVIGPMLKCVLHFCYSCIEYSQCSIRCVVCSSDFRHRQHMLGPANPLIQRFGHISSALLLISHMSILAFVDHLEFQMNLACSDLSPLSMIRL